VMATAQRLGATELLRAWRRFRRSAADRELWAACDLAAGYGLSANLEPMALVDVSTVAKARRIVDARQGIPPCWSMRSIFFAPKTASPI